MIPATIHFIWVSLGETLPELYKLCILSAVKNTKCKVVLHTDDPIVLPDVETRLREFPKVINGVPFNKDEDVKHGKDAHFGGRVSHLKDVVRLEILYAEGGIYSDLDCLWLRDPWMFRACGKGVVMGFQTESYKTLCNAVIFAVPQHPLIKAYLDWTVSIYPPKRYWIPANPYKLWEGKNEDALYVKRHHFFQHNFIKDNAPIELEDYIRSTCIHLRQSAGYPITGGLIDLVKAQVFN
jgi:hypothetical protein